MVLDNDLVLQIVTGKSTSWTNDKNLFRGMRIDNGEWVFGDLITNKNKSYIHPKENDFAKDSFIEIKPETVGQFTTLIDKNRKKVFEGDIIVFNMGRNLPNVSIVPRIVFYDELNSQFTKYVAPFSTLERSAVKDEGEVVGSMYENFDILVDSVKAQLNNETKYSNLDSPQYKEFEKKFAERIKEQGKGKIDYEKIELK